VRKCDRDTYKERQRDNKTKSALSKELSRSLALSISRSLALSLCRSLALSLSRSLALSLFAYSQYAHSLSFAHSFSLALALFHFLAANALSLPSPFCSRAYFCFGFLLALVHFCSIALYFKIWECSLIVSLSSRSEKH